MARQGKTKQVYKHDVATAFAMWESMPFIFGEMNIIQVRRFGYGKEDNAFLERLLKCKTDEDFSKEFKISRQTVSVWRKDERIIKMIEELNKKSNVLRFKKDVDFAFTRKTIIEADASRVRLWYELYIGFVPNSKVENPALEETSRALRAILEQG